MALRERTARAGALLIFDEIQTGFGRTGSLFAFEHFGVRPDILTVAKAMGGGMPLGAFISSQEIFGVFRDNPPLSHVTTFGGHPVSCAAGHASLSAIIDEQLAARAVAVGHRIRERLVHPAIREVRGMGALLGMEIVDRRITEATVNTCIEEGVLLGWTLHSNTLVRIAPPLNIPFDVLDTALTIILGAIDKAVAE